MKYLEKDKNDLKYVDYEQFSGNVKDLHNFLEIRDYTISGIDDFIINPDNPNRKSYKKTYNGFSVKFDTIEGEKSFIVVEGDYISNHPNFHVIGKEEFEEKYMPSKYHALRDELNNTIDTLNSDIERLKIRDEELPVDDKKREFWHKEYTDRIAVRDLFRKAMQKVRTIKLD